MLLGVRAHGGQDIALAHLPTSVAFNKCWKDGYVPHPLLGM